MLINSNVTNSNTGSKIEDGLGYLRNQCYDVYEKICLQLQTIALVSQLCKSHYKETTKNNSLKMKITLAKVVDYASKITHNFTDTNFRIQSEVLSLLAHHNAEEAIFIANSISDKDWKSYTLHNISKSIVDENPNLAITILKQATIKQWKAKALAHISNAIFYKDPTVSKIALDKALKLGSSIKKPYQSFEVSIECLHPLSKHYPLYLNEFKSQLVKSAMNFIDKVDKARGLRLVAEFCMQDDPKEAIKFLHLSDEAAQEIDLRTIKIDCLSHNYRVYNKLNSKKANKLLLKIIGFCQSISTNPFDKSLGFIKIAAQLPFNRIRTMEGMLSQAYSAAQFIKAEENKEYVLKELAQIHSRIYPELAILDSTEIKDPTYRALAYCHIANNLQEYFN